MSSLALSAAAAEDALEQDFLSDLRAVEAACEALPLATVIRAERWVEKLTSTPHHNVAHRRDRNAWARLLAAASRSGRLEGPFARLPKDGALEALPQHLKPPQPKSAQRRDFWAHAYDAARKQKLADAPSTPGASAHRPSHPAPPTLPRSSRSPSIASRLSDERAFVDEPSPFKFADAPRRAGPRRAEAAFSHGDAVDDMVEDAIAALARGDERPTAFDHFIASLDDVRASLRHAAAAAR